MWCKSTTFRPIHPKGNSFFFFDFDNFYIFIFAAFRINRYLCSSHSKPSSMKIKGLLLSLLIASPMMAMAQNIELPAPQKQGGQPLMQVLAQRASTRQFDTARAIEPQTMADLLWAAWGYNREDKRTAPSALNRQEISLYVITAQGAYCYDARQNVLTQVAAGDFRKSAGKQPFAQTAPLNIVFVADLDKAPSNDMMFVDCGFIAQNIYLYCASAGLGSVVRGSFDAAELAQVLKLNERQKVVLTQTVGYPAR